MTENRNQVQISQFTRWSIEHSPLTICWRDSLPPSSFPYFSLFTLNLHWNHLILGNFNKYLPYQIIKSCKNLFSICDEFDYLRRRRRRRKWISDDKMVGGVVALGPCCARWPLFPLYALLNFCSSRDYLLIFRYNIGRHDAWWQRGPPSGF